MNRHLSKKPAERGARHTAEGLQKFFEKENNGLNGLNKMFKKLSGVVRQEWFEHETIKAIEEISSDAIFIVGMDRKIIQCSDSAQNVFGYEKNELNGMDASRLLYNKSNGPFTPMPQSGLIGKAACSYERKDGSNFPGEFSGKIVTDRDGIPSFMVIAIWDMTDREMNLMRQKAKSVSIVAGGLAHDINNMMTGVIGYMELAKTRTKNDGPHEFLDYVNKAMSVTMEIKALMQKFNTISGFTVSRGDHIPLGPLMPQLEAKLKGMAAAKKASLHFSAGSDCAILGDSMKMVELLEILAVNAIESLPETGGTVSIMAQKEANKITVTVADNGKGIDENIIGKIFDPYFSTKPRSTQKGMGLSLAVVHSLVALFKGDIAVHSKKGEGTTFTMAFPPA